MSENPMRADSDVVVSSDERESCVYRPASGSPEEPLLVAVVEALAEAKGVSPTELDDPLYDAVDPEAVEALFDSSDQVERGRLVFTVDDYELTVTARNDIYVHKLE